MKYYEYNESTAKAKVLYLLRILHQRIRTLMPDRYRFVLQAMMFPDENQGKYLLILSSDQTILELG